MVGAKRSRERALSAGPRKGGRSGAGGRLDYQSTTCVKDFSQPGPLSAGMRRSESDATAAKAHLAALHKEIVNKAEILPGALWKPGIRDDRTGESLRYASAHLKRAWHISADVEERVQEADDFAEHSLRFPVTPRKTLPSYTHVHNRIFADPFKVDLQARLSQLPLHIAKANTKHYTHTPSLPLASKPLNPRP